MTKVKFVHIYNLLRMQEIEIKGNVNVIPSSPICVLFPLSSLRGNVGMCNDNFGSVLMSSVISQDIMMFDLAKEDITLHNCLSYEITIIPHVSEINILL